MFKIIVGVSKNGVIGNQNSLPWHSPDDMKHFKETTIDNIVVMGYNTWLSLGKKPLPNRRNIIYNPKLEKEVETLSNDCVMVNSVGQAHFVTYLHKMSSSRVRHAYLIGGAKTYELFLKENLVDELIVTRFDFECEGDTFFHIPDEWKCFYEKIISKDAIVGYYTK